MRNLRTAVAAFAVTGLTAFGAMAATGGVANAATNQSIAGCETNSGLVTVGLFVECQAADSTFYNPTSIKATVDTSFLTKLLGQGVKVSYDLTCLVDGSPVTRSEGFTAHGPGSSVQVINLQHEVGSPSPNQCTVEHLKAKSLLALTIAHIPFFTFGVKVTGDNGIPGAIWAQYPPSTSGAGSTVCADDTGNMNAGTHIQAFQCEQDLADAWMQVSHQLIHNGDCMTNVNGTVKLEKCEGGQWSAPNQTWWVKGTPMTAGQITNGKGWCLSSPASGMVDGSHLTVQHCGAHGFVQMWKAPANTPV